MIPYPTNVTNVPPDFATAARRQSQLEYSMYCQHLSPFGNEPAYEINWEFDERQAQQCSYCHDAWAMQEIAAVRLCDKCYDWINLFALLERTRPLFALWLTHPQACPACPTVERNADRTNNEVNYAGLLRATTLPCSDGRLLAAP